MALVTQSRYTIVKVANESWRITQPKEQNKEVEEEERERTFSQ